LQERKLDGHVSLERGAAHRELGLVPGGDDEPAELVRERHQEHAAGPRLDVLLGRVWLVACEDVGERLEEALYDRLDRELEEGGAERLGEAPRIATRLLRAEARRHRDAMDAVRPERLAGDRRRQRGVDPARDADDDILESVLR